jgi:HKD family nuclease
MRIVLSNRRDALSLTAAIDELARGARTLSIAVSYLQRSGWELFRNHTRGLNPQSMRIVCTDQMGITQPAAVRSALKSGAQVHNFTGGVTYHPKLYLAHDGAGRPTRFLLGSANMSFAAFTDSTEACVLGTDPAGLRTLNEWFNDLFQNRSARFTADQLRRMEENWRAAASSRARARLSIRRGLVLPSGPPLLEADDLDTLEDVFATVQLPIGTLNIDYAGNNIRNLSHVCEIIAKQKATWTAKQRSELKLLGFADGGQLTALGHAAARADGLAEVARLWCGWLQTTDNVELRRINPRLLVAKRVFPQFWHLQRQVRDYFLANATNPRDRQTPKTIELLCNAGDVVQEFSLEDIRTLAPLLEQPRRLPTFVAAAVSDYEENKGRRGWRFSDRRIVPLAWSDAAAAE